MVEHRRPERHLPGAWYDEDEWFWEDAYFGCLAADRQYRKGLGRQKHEQEQSRAVEEVSGDEVDVGVEDVDEEDEVQRKP